MQIGLTVHAVVQARMSSSRLPGKVLRRLGGRSVLGWVIRAAYAVNGIDKVIVATSDARDDDAVAEEAQQHGAAVVRGPLDDVLARFLLACAEYPADAVVRLTADCPLLDPGLITQLVALWRAQPELDYVSTTLVRTLPRGFDAELVRVPVLTEQAGVPTGPHREHVTSGIYLEPERYACSGLVAAPVSDDLRVTLDTEQDWALLEALVAEWGDRTAVWREIVRILRARPDLVALNAQVEQRNAE